MSYHHVMLLLAMCVAVVIHVTHTTDCGYNSILVRAHATDYMHCLALECAYTTTAEVKRGVIC
jgi:hypothetical protein